MVRVAKNGAYAEAQSVEELSARLRVVTPEDVQRVAQRYLDPAAAVLVDVEPVTG